MKANELLTTLRNAADVALGRRKVALATTPHDVLQTDNKARLLAYHQESPRYRTPVLLVPSMVNRHTLLDLTEENSIVRSLLRAGYRVYMLDWGRPSREDRHLPAEEYVDGVMHRAVRRCLTHSGAPSLSLSGYCMGGTMALIYAARFPELVRNLVLLATPIDFEHGGKLKLWSEARAFDVDAFLDGRGNAPPEALQPAFDMLIPTWRLRNWTTFMSYGHMPMFVKQFTAILQWTTDNVEVPAEVFRVVARDLYQENRLVRGGMMLGGREVRLADVKASIYNAASKADHIVVPPCAHALNGRVASKDLTEIAFPCGHLGLSIGAEAHTVVWPAISTWLAERSA